MQAALHTTSPTAIARAAQAFVDRAQNAANGSAGYDELSFATLLDLQDEASEDDSFDTFNDVARELKSRRDDGKDALRRLFIEQAQVGGEVPMAEGGRISKWTMSAYMREVLDCAQWTAMVIDVALGVISRETLIAAMARDYASEQSEDLLRAGWTQ